MKDRHGYICSYRSLLDWEWWDDHDTTRLWVAILHSVNWKENQWRGITVKRGQMVTSFESLSKLTGLSMRKIRTSLSRLKMSGNITYEPSTKTTRNGSILTVCKWETYQSDEPQNDIHKGKDNDTETDTRGDTQNDKQATCNEEGNNIRKKKYNDRFLKFWSSYPRKIGKDKAWQVWKRKQSDMPDLDTLLEAVSAWAASEEWQKDGGQYVPHPTTWLNRAGWEDEIPSHKGGGPGKFGSGGGAGSEDDVAAKYGS